jgi:hypothetical protein
VQKIRKKYILILFALFPIRIDEITAVHQIVTDEQNHILFYHVRPTKQREQNEKELESQHKMIEAGAQQLNLLSHSPA